MENAYQKAIAQIENEFNTSSKNGLSGDQAKDKLQEYGPNKLKESKQKSLWAILIAQIANPVIYLLTAAAVLAFVFGDIAEGIAILVVLVANTIIGFWMEYQAQKSMEAIKEMDKTEAMVLRDGKDKTIDAEEIVPGDILIVKAGVLIPADARVFEATELKVDESPLTGESVPVSKNPEDIEGEKQIGDRNNILHKGTAVTGGTGKAIVFATGMDTEMGNISAMVNEQEDDETPLNKKLHSLTHNLIWVILGMAAAFFLFGWIAGKDIYQLIQTSIAWAIAAIPEGLPIVASIALARGMYRLSKKNVLVKKLAAVETLGETTVIFTDKTGTLTKNELTVKGFLYPKSDYKKVDWNNSEKPVIKGIEKSDSQQNFKQLFKISVLANDANLKDNDDENDAQGDPLEIALLSFTKHFDKGFYTENKDLEREGHIPFDSDIMLMGAVYNQENGHYIAGKGSTDAILERCDTILIDGAIEDFSDSEKEKWKKSNNELAEDGLRVLAFAYKEVDNFSNNEENNFLQGLTFAGLIAFIDPPRKEVADAIETCRNAGIKVVMVTGDHPGTSKNVGKTVKIFDDEKDYDSVVLHGKNLNKDLEEDNNEKLVNTPIFSRVDPEQKLSLISHYQDQGEIVGMTGDGVNDAPALKKADIGIAMGKRGTQVAQEVSDVVLQDDQFQSIVKAIEQGRIIFGNIRRFVLYQLSYHFAEIIIIALMSFTLFILPILPLQLLFLNLLSDVFPALALGIGEGNPHIMKDPPKDPKEPIITRKNWWQIGIYGFIIAASVSGAYLYAHFVWETSEEINNNIAFFSLAFAQFLHVFNMREGDEPLLNNQVTKNKYVWMALAFCIAGTLAGYFIPALKEIFQFQDLDIRTWILIVIAGVLPSVIIQFIKLVKKDF
ncbi:cation-transporting P-type ATPase [Zunongwangia sp. SCSIO 43204]|uniref:cation-translocating P-type ATPase n=1 Tax=Zunongwangia sp. SCSIO 43204 TaxID=2779359 RepID=UPI001CA82E91|nr:cation-transporting P-type ATPase [Zunongwangia sp. SCSIO 43204]UAB85654.1 cation-transporting P-type ATPase [Zunongwangia sp. SCSIO 43204]